MSDTLVVLELWEGIYLEEIGNEFDWSCYYLSAKYSDRTPDILPDYFKITNDVSKAGKIYERFGDEWLSTFCSVFPNAKWLHIKMNISSEEMN